MTEPSASSLVERWDLGRRIIVSSKASERSIRFIPLLLGIINGIEIDLGREEAVTWVEPLVRPLVEFHVGRASRPQPCSFSDFTFSASLELDAESRLLCVFQQPLCEFLPPSPLRSSFANELSRN